MAVKCTECGASIQDDSKFCKYCGAKIIEENLKKVEVKIDNTAEIKRANYEEQESLLRQEKMKRELRKEKRKPIVIIAKILTIIIPLAIGWFYKGDGVMSTSLLVLSVMIFGLWFFLFLSKHSK